MHIIILKSEQQQQQQKTVSNQSTYRDQISLQVFFSVFNFDRINRYVPSTKEFFSDVTSWCYIVFGGKYLRNSHLAIYSKPADDLDTQIHGRRRVIIKSNTKETSQNSKEVERFRALIQSYLVEHGGLQHK